MKWRDTPVFLEQARRSVLCSWLALVSCCCIDHRHAILWSIIEYPTTVFPDDHIDYVEPNGTPLSIRRLWLLHQHVNTSTRQHVKWTANSSAPFQHSQGQPISRFHNNTVSYPATVISQQGSTRRGVGKVQSGPSTTKKDRHVTDDIQIKQS